MASRSSSPRADAVEQRRAFHQLVARERKQPALRRARRPRGPICPTRCRNADDRARRAELADEVDLADVDAELERGGRHQRLELAVLEPLLGVEALLLGQAAVVRGDVLGAEPVGQLRASPARPSAGVDEDQRGAVRLDQVRETLIDLLPHLGRHHRFERRVRNLEREIARAAVAGVDDGAVGAGAAVRSRLRPESARPPRSASAWPERPTRCSRSPHSAARRSSESARWVPRLLGAQRVDLVDDHGAGGREHARGPTPSRAGCRAIPAWSPTMCGGRRRMRSRSPAGVSPVRTQVRISTSGKPCACSAARMPASGASRLRWMSFDSALSGET